MATQTKHSTDCRRVFSNYDLRCPRCQELACGKPARAGWSDLRRRNEANRVRWIREHDCRQAGCGPICTFGDW